MARVTLALCAAVLHNSCVNVKFQQIPALALALVPQKKSRSRLLWDTGEGTIAAAYGIGQWAAICCLPQSFAA